MQLASTHKVLATTKDMTTRSTQQNKYLECALQLFQLFLSLFDSNSTFKENGIDSCDLESLVLSVLALHGLVVCSTMKNVSQPVHKKFTKKLSALQDELLAHKGLIKLLKIHHLAWQEQLE